ncbi:hypothetical protein DSECCO2_408890 [anaerobic digester metagenome]
MNRIRRAPNVYPCQGESCLAINCGRDECKEKLLLDFLPEIGTKDCPHLCIRLFKDGCKFYCSYPCPLPCR